METRFVWEMGDPENVDSDGCQTPSAEGGGSEKRRWFTRAWGFFIFVHCLLVYLMLS